MILGPVLFFFGRTLPNFESHIAWKYIGRFSIKFDWKVSTIFAYESRAKLQTKSKCWLLSSNGKSLIDVCCIEISSGIESINQMKKSHIFSWFWNRTRNTQQCNEYEPLEKEKSPLNVLLEHLHSDVSNAKPLVKPITRLLCDNSVLFFFIFRENVKNLNRLKCRHFHDWNCFSYSLQCAAKWSFEIRYRFL